MSWYLTIAPATGARTTVDTARVVAFLASLPELRQTGPIGFASVAGRPGTQVILALAAASGGYASHGEFIPRINLVELVCAHAGGADWHDALASRIAAHLDWVAVEEHAQRQVWPPVARAGNDV